MYYIATGSRIQTRTCVSLQQVNLESVVGADYQPVTFYDHKYIHWICSTRSLIYCSSHLNISCWICSLLLKWLNQKPKLQQHHLNKSPTTIWYFVANWHQFNSDSRPHLSQFSRCTYKSSFSVTLPALRQAPMTMTLKKINVVLSRKLPYICMKITCICHGWRVAY